jgi:hypothetical protein
LEQFENRHVCGAAATLGAPMSVDLRGGRCAESANEFKYRYFRGVTEFSLSADGAQVLAGKVEAKRIKAFAMRFIIQAADRHTDALKRLIDGSNRIRVLLPIHLELFDLFRKVDQFHKYHH